MAPADNNVCTRKNGRWRLANSLTGPPGISHWKATRGQQVHERLRRVRIPRRTLNADHALPVGPASPAHSPLTTRHLPSEHCSSDSTLTGRWRQAKRRETYPPSCFTPASRRWGTVYSPRSTRIYSPAGSLLPVIHLRCPVGLIRYYYYWVWTVSCT